MASLVLMPGTLPAQVQTYTCPGGFGVLPPAAVPIPPDALLFPLNNVPNPVLPGGALRKDLRTHILDLPTAIQLGKALFWDMQAGSDNKTACATCHSPELRIPNGHNADGTDNEQGLPAVGKLGAKTPVKRFLSLNPFQQ